MKKRLLLATFLLAAVINFANLKDGIYYVEKSYDNNWNSFVRITVKNDKIIGAQYDRKNKDGELLSLNQKENDKYKGKYGSSFRDVTLSITRSFVTTQNINTLEKTTDSSATNEFQSMVNFLIKKAETGETGTFRM